MLGKLQSITELAINLCCSQTAKRGHISRTFLTPARDYQSRYLSSPCHAALDTSHVDPRAIAVVNDSESPSDQV